MGIGNNLGDPLTRLARAEASLERSLNRAAFAQSDIKRVEQRLIAVSLKMFDLLEHLERRQYSLMHPIVLIAASLGGFDPLRDIVAALPVPCGAAIFIVSHIGAQRSVLPSILAHSSGLPTIHAHDNAAIEAGHIYVAPPDHHMFLELGLIRLSRGPKVHHTRPAADPLFISAARVYRQRVIGIVLSGGDGDAAIGLRTVREHGGITFVQRPETAEAPGMPRSAIAAGQSNAVLSVSEIARRVAVLCSRHGMLPSDTKD